LLGAVAVAALTTATLCFKQHCLPHSRAVRKNVLYRSGQPRGPGLHVLRLHGIRTVVNLRAPGRDGVQAEREFCDRHGIAFHIVPVGHTREDIAECVTRFLAVLDDSSNWPVLVHCSRGKERAGVLSAVFRMEFDHWPNQRALHEMYGRGLTPGSMSVAETYVWDYQPRWRDEVVVGNTATEERHPAVWQD